MNRLMVAIAALIFFGTNAAHAQFSTSATKVDNWKKTYRLTPEKINDLVHTKLDVKFDFEKSYLYGKAWLTLKPHFYTLDSLRLDAKGMEVKQVAMVSNGKTLPLKYDYSNSMQLAIQLDRMYKMSEQYTIYIEYTAKPDELKAGGSAAIREAKGLYFINPKGAVKDKPTEVWTQGETEASSAWFPTIDRPNQKTTAEIIMTVPDKYVTLSNGLMTAQKKNTDGTRTDTWKMDLPHSPYLFFMGVGEFAVVKDTYKGKEVSYYVEKDFEKVARKIFGLTPEMINCFSTKLGFEYPWAKYAQMVGRDYVSGAMENTSATLHGEVLQQNARQLMDGNKYEEYISHELFHQWFGDLVTTESWSNLTVNESMANFGEVIWNDWKYGREIGDAKNAEDMQKYLQTGGADKNLVRFIYRDKEDMFDQVTYEKGGRIQYMLRNIVGDDAYYKSLNLYLNTYKFKNAEADQLRLAFEEVTGRDLTWFWNQWYYGSGHPKLAITYGYDDATKMATVLVEQKQSGDKVFQMPVAIDLYNGTTKTRHNVWLQNKTDSFSFAASAKPDLINFDGDKYLLCEKDENKTIEQYAFQYRSAKKFMDRSEAIDFATENKTSTLAVQLLTEALADSVVDIRITALKSLQLADVDAPTLTKIAAIAANDPRRLARAAAISLLGRTGNEAYKDLFVKAVMDSSYSVAGAGLNALADMDEAKATALLPMLKGDAKGRLKSAVESVEMLQKTDADFDSVTAHYDRKGFMQKANEFPSYIKYLAKVTNNDNFKKGLAKMVSLRKNIGGFSPEFKKIVNDQLLALKAKKEAQKAAGNKDLDEQIALLEKTIKE